MKKSSFAPPLRGICPCTMRCAFCTIRLCCAWRKISVRRTVGTVCVRRISPRMLPGPTLGNWSASPTMMIRQWERAAASSAWNSLTSTMLISSNMMTSYLRRFFSLWIKRTAPEV